MTGITELAWLRREKRDKAAYRESILDRLKSATDGRLDAKIGAADEQADEFLRLSEQWRQHAKDLRGHKTRLLTEDGRRSVKRDSRQLSAEILVLKWLIGETRSGNNTLAMIVKGKKSRKPARLILDEQGKIRGLKWITRFAMATKDEAKRMIEGLLDTKIHHED